MVVKLVALDIDGTVVRHDENTPRPEVANAIGELVGLGVAVVLASGRMFPGTAAIANQLGLSTPLICQQGCGIHSRDGALLHSVPIDRKTALSLVSLARELGYPYEWFNPVRYLVSEETPEAREYGRVSGIEPEFGANPEDSGVEPTGVGIISNRRDARSVKSRVDTAHGDRLHVLDFPSVTVAVSARASKAHALALLCGEMGVDRSSVIAVGDSVNDASMLEWAGVGFAMANADRYAAAAADEMLPDEPDALGNLLESLVRARRSRG
ncbi:MAG: HAD hydrolase family protein [Dehalococcoidia bacterium]